MVLYTADVEEAETSLERTACSIRVEAAHLTGVHSEGWLEEVECGINEGRITDEMLMHLVILPLTYKGVDEKQDAIRRCVDLAKRIPDKEQEAFALAGILSFTDKVISDGTKQYIKEVLSMTQVGRMLLEEGRKEGILEAATQTALNMLGSGAFSIEEIRKYVPSLSFDEIEHLARRADLT